MGVVNPSFDELFEQGKRIGILSTARGFTSIVKPIRQTFMYEVTEQVAEGNLTQAEAKIIIKATRGIYNPRRKKY